MHRLPIVLVAGLALAASAQEESRPPRPPAEIRLTLREAVHLALNHNLDIEIARYQPWLDDQDIRAAFGAFDHVLYADASTGRNRLAARDQFVGVPVLSTEDSTFKTGIRRTIPMGLSYDLNVAVDRQESNSQFAVIDPLWQQSVGVGLALPFLRGAGEEANGTPILLAKNSRRLSVGDFERSLSDTVLSVQEAYWALVGVLEVKRFREQSLEAARRLLEDNRKRFARGILARVDVTEAEAGVASQVEGILTAENAVMDTMDRLKRIVDPTLLRGDVRIVPLDAPAAEAVELDEAQAVERGVRDALERRPEVRSLAVELESRIRELARADNDALPRLTASATGMFVGSEDAWSQATREFGSGDTYAWSAGIALEIPLENRAADGARRRAELDRRRAILRRRNLEDEILLEVRAAARGIKTAERRIEATTRARELTQEQYDGEMSRREQGLRTTFHVLEAHSKLTDAQGNEVRAKVAYATAWAKYRRATGALLGYHDILVEPNLVPRQGTN